VKKNLQGLDLLLNRRDFQVPVPTPERALEAEKVPNFTIEILKMHLIRDHI
jgi:hypothetical protein